MKPDLTLITLGCAGLAAAVSAVGALPFAFGWHPRTAVGAAYALPGGVMLGAAYLLGTRSLDRSIPLAGLGVALGLAFIYWTARFTETSDEEESPDPAAGYRHLLRDSLHSASEGVAIGVAMAASPAFGIFVAIALALHNVGEGMGLTAFLQARGMSVGECAGLAVAAKVSQPLLAVATLAVLDSLPDLVPGALGLASGALLSLVLGELVPAAFRHAPRTFIAVLLSASAAAVLLFEDLLL